MADSLLSFDITFGDVIYFIVVKGSKSLFKGTLNLVHLRTRHQCKDCQEDVYNTRVHNAEKKGATYV